MKRIIITLLAAAAVSGAAMAQQVWTLDSCINYAVSHNLTVMNRELQTESSRQAITEAKDRFLPQVAGSAGQSFNFGRGLTSENTYANRNTQNFNVGIGLQLPLFQGLAGVRRVSYAKANLATALLELEAEKDNVELNVITQFLQCLYAREVMEVAKEKHRMSVYELDRRRQLLDAGKIAELDITEAVSQLAQDEADVVTTENDLRLALLTLAQTLRLPEGTPFDIIADDGGSAEPPILPAGEVNRSAFERNNALRASRAAINAADRGIDLARSGYLPTLSLSAGLNTNYYRLGGIENPAFRSQMRDNFSKYIGFSLNVPIFDAFGTRNSLRQARLQKRQAELAYMDKLDNLRQTISQAELQARNSLRKWRATDTAEQAALEAFRGMEQKYNYGKASATDYENSRSAYIRARLLTVQSHYEYLLRCRILEFYNR